MVVVVVDSVAVAGLAAGLAAGVTVSVFCSQAASNAVPARMQMYFFIIFYGNPNVGQTMIRGKNPLRSCRSFLEGRFVSHAVRLRDFFYG